MPTVGRTTTSGNNFWNQNTGSNNQIGFKVTMPEAGLIRTLHVYVSGNGGTITGRLVLWKSNGTIAAQTGDITFSSGSTGINAQNWQQGNLTTPYAAAKNEVLYIGFWRNSSQTANYSWINSGGTISPSPSGSQANVGSPSTLNTGSTATGQLSAYADYVTGGLGYASGGTVKKYALKYALAGVFKRHPLKRYSTTASAWQWFA